jgi:hypothetical protein
MYKLKPATMQCCTRYYSIAHDTTALRMLLQHCVGRILVRMLMAVIDSPSCCCCFAQDSVPSMDPPLARAHATVVATWRDDYVWICGREARGDATQELAHGGLSYGACMDYQHIFCVYVGCWSERCGTEGILILHSNSCFVDRRVGGRAQLARVR